jgi:uncharacterized protein
VAEASAYVGVLEVDLHFPDAGNLKAKRKDLKSIKDVLRGRFGAAVAETGHQDRWQRSTVVATLTSGSLQLLDQELDTVERWLDGRCPTGVGIRRTVVSVAELADIAGVLSKTPPAQQWGG